MVNNKIDIMKNNFMPPRSLFRRLSHIYNKRKRLAVGIGIMRWAINTYSVTESGSLWAQHYCSVRSYPAHNFFSYHIDGRVRNGIEVLETVSSIDQRCPLQYSDEDLVNAVVDCIVDSGAKDVFLDRNEKYSPNDIMRSIREAQRWMWSHEGMRVIIENTRWGSLHGSRADPGDSLFKYSIGTGTQFFDPYDGLRTEKLMIMAKHEYECDGCGQRVACAELNAQGQRYCKHCLGRIHNSKSFACNHMECGLHDCIHYTDQMVNEELDLEPPLPQCDEWMGDDMEHEMYDF